MKKRFSPPYARILFLLLTSVVSQGDGNAPPCPAGSYRAYNTTTASPSDGMKEEAKRLPPSATESHCVEDTPDGVLIHAGGSSDQYWVAPKDGITTDQKAAALAITADLPTSGSATGNTSTQEQENQKQVGKVAATLSAAAIGMGPAGIYGKAMAAVALDEQLKPGGGPPVGDQSTGKKSPPVDLAHEPVVAQDAKTGEYHLCLGLPPSTEIPEFEPPPAPLIPQPPARSPASTPTSPSPANGAATPAGGGGAAGAISVVGSGPAAPTSIVLADPAAISVPVQNPGGPDSRTTPSVVDTAYNSAVIADWSRGADIAEASIAARQATIASAGADQATLSQPYRNLSTGEMGGYLERAQNSLNDAVNVFENATGSSLESSERARFHNFFLNARDKAQLGLDAIHDEQASIAAMGEDSPFAGLLAAKNANPLAKNEALAGIFGAQLGAATTGDALVNRMVMFNGLPADAREGAAAKLKLAEQPTFTLPNGQQAQITLLHNGYLLGGGSTAVDCSSFVSSMLPTDVRRGRFTTLDFRTMWIYDKTLVFPKDPTYKDEERAKLVKATASAFIPIDVYAGQHLRVGDLLVYRLAKEPFGHIVIVRDYNPATLRAEIVEASQSSGSIAERTLDLSPDPLTAKRRLLMPGLWALRIKPVTNQACAYRDGPRGPATSRAAHVVEPHDAGGGP